MVSFVFSLNFSLFLLHFGPKTAVQFATCLFIILLNYWEKSANFRNFSRFFTKFEMKLEARLALCNLRKLKNHQYSCRQFHGPPKKEEYSDKPEYPPIRKFKSKDEEKYSELKSFMKNLQTVEEKQIYLNKPKYYGWYSCVMKNTKIGPTTLDFLQFVTNTTIGIVQHLIHSNFWIKWYFPYS